MMANDAYRFVSYIIGKVFGMANDITIMICETRPLSNNCKSKIVSNKKKRFIEIHIFFLSRFNKIFLKFSFPRLPLNYLNCLLKENRINLL